jgi:hypothetical protein
MQNLNPEKLAAIAQAAFDRVPDSRRWQTAIVRALPFEVQPTDRADACGHARRAARCEVATE